MTGWYVVYTQARGELKAVDHLQRQSYAVYLPRCRRWRSHARSRELVLRPLFPRYLFVALDLGTMPWRPILSTIGVAGLVRHGDEPVPVPPGLVEALRQAERDRAFDQPSPADRWKLGDPVRITSGPFAEMIGRFQGLADEERVYVLLDLLGRPVKTCLTAGALESV